jgi:hypothetical protein
VDPKGGAPPAAVTVEDPELAFVNNYILIEKNYA